MKRHLCTYGIGLALGGLLTAVTLPGVSAAETVMDYFTYDTLPGNQQGERIQYVKVNLDQAWNHLKISERNPQLCNQGDNLNPTMSVLQNPQPAMPQNCNFTNYTWWKGQGGQFQDYRFVVNANFFAIPPSPFTQECGKGLGVAVNDQVWVSGEAPADRLVHNRPTNTLIVYNQEGYNQHGVRAEIVDQNYDFAANINHIQAAVSGYRFMTNGAFTTVTSKADPNNDKPRTAVGLSQNGRDLIFLSINVGRGSLGAKLRLNDNFYKSLVLKDAYNALYLDGGGSATLVLQNQQGATVLSTLPSDVRNIPDHPPCSQRFYRPAPVVFGVE